MLQRGGPTFILRIPPGSSGGRSAAQSLRGAPTFLLPERRLADTPLGEASRRAARAVLRSSPFTHAPGDLSEAQSFRQSDRVIHESCRPPTEARAEERELRPMCPGDRGAHTRFPVRIAVCALLTLPGCPRDKRPQFLSGDPPNPQRIVRGARGQPFAGWIKGDGKD